MSKNGDYFADIFEESNNYIIVPTTKDETEKKEIDKLANKYNGKYNRKKKGWIISKKVFDEFEKELKLLMDIKEDSSDEESEDDIDETAIQESLKKFKEQRKNRPNERKRIEGYEIEDSDCEDTITNSRRLRNCLDKIKELEDKVKRLESNKKE